MEPTLSARHPKGQRPRPWQEGEYPEIHLTPRHISIKHEGQGHKACGKHRTNGSPVHTAAHTCHAAVPLPLKDSCKCSPSAPLTAEMTSYTWNVLGCRDVGQTPLYTPGWPLRPHQEPPEKPHNQCGLVNIPRAAVNTAAARATCIPSDSCLCLMKPLRRGLILFYKGRTWGTQGHKQAAQVSTVYTLLETLLLWNSSLDIERQRITREADELV